MKKVLLGLLALLAIGAVFVATRPNTFRVERSTVIAAPAEVIYPLLADFHRWEGWSPWEKLDPAMTKTFGGAASGVGATYHWLGNNDVGEGRMTITAEEPPARVVILLEFLKPFAATNNCEFALAPQGAGTQVTWSMDGKNNFVSKAMGVFVSMDKMLGGDFEKGLAGLKALAEASAASAVPAPADTTASP